MNNPLDSNGHAERVPKILSFNMDRFEGGTSVKDETYGVLKTKIAEQWALDKGFDVRRVDRRILSSDRLDNSDPRLALSGVDKVEARKLIAKVGFDCIIDAGLSRTSSDFDRYRVTVFDHIHPIDRYFAEQNDEPVGEAILEGKLINASKRRSGAAERRRLAELALRLPM